MYQVKELKYLVGETLVAGLNNLGDACGTGDALGAPVGLIWYANGLVKQMANASFTAINDANFVVGMESPGGIVGAETEQLTYTTLGLMIDATNAIEFKSPAASQATCLSEPSVTYPQGLALGYQMNLGTANNPNPVPTVTTLRWIPGHPPALLKLPAGFTSFVPRCINVEGDFVGFAGGPQVPATFYLCRSGNWIRLFASIQVWDMNKALRSVGTIITGSAGNPDYVPAYWDGLMPGTQIPPTLVPLPPGGFWGGQANGINDANTIVGTCYPSNPNYDRSTGALNPDNVAFVNTAAGSVDLNTQIHAPGWKLQSAVKINNKGQIVGLGIHNGVSTSFLLE